MATYVLIHGASSDSWYRHRVGWSNTWRPTASSCGAEDHTNCPRWAWQMRAERGQNG